ncbi:hypothetical protein [Flagellimonas zhangzhouensis]|uniref:Outer membrane protein beta-barrel domain-containing protein n=1 Tax=Flagellimonas zhangzhouensis TaxID=1073328 RepID=A0A1H2XZ05_9FLAO|nr:hypothetical protein [Allomuricauda zhangzhouensis]SDQ93272.1 hypothetical protein SAMN05216294_2897 [Allomuricauda zhangzhouensis]SDW97955.1 hypothetical protein SAMN04487892_2889 [Allomuricauda zhangzhouensis]
MFKLHNYHIALLVLLGQIGYSQAIQLEEPEKDSFFYIEGFTYPSFNEIDHYGWFRINGRIWENTEIGLGGEHYRRWGADRLKLAARLKQRISETTSVIGGYQQEWDLYNEGKGFPNPVPRQELFFGVEKDIRPNMMMGIKLVQPLGTYDFHSLGLEDVNTRIELGTRVKF